MVCADLEAEPVPAHTTRSRIVLLATALLLAPALAGLSPPASATPVVLDHFLDGSASATLNFSSRTWNDTLALEVPRGATVLSAAVTVAGVEGSSIACATMDFSTNPVGDDLWALYKGGINLYPPDVDPYASGWPLIAAADVRSIKAADNIYWHTQTPNAPKVDPWEWALQLYHFHPGVAAPRAYELSWRGYGYCSANRSNIPYQGELWLYNHTNTTWDKIAGFTGNVAGDRWLNASFDAGSDYASSNGSVDAAIVGPHSDAQIQVPNPKIDNGHIYTDYIGLRIDAAGTLEFPWNATLDVAGSRMDLSSGPLSGTVVVGDSLGLRQAIQRTVDAATVMPGSVTAALNFSVAWPTFAALEVRGLRVVYEPVVNAPPAWRGPASCEVQEDSQWTEVLDLGAAFSDDHNQDALRFAIVSASDPANLSTRVQFGVSGNWTLAVKPTHDLFGDFSVALNATDLFGAVTVSPPITVRVIQVPDRPILEDPGELHATEGVPFNSTLHVVDADLPDDAFTFNDNSDYLDVDPATGRFDWTPAKDQVGTHRFSVTVTDRFALTSTVAVNIVVANVNDPPAIESALALVVDQDEFVSYVIEATDPDLPFGDSVTYYAFSEDIEVACDMSTGRVTFTPTNDNVGVLSILIRVQDRAGLKDDRTLAVTVGNVNDPPALQEVGDQTHAQGDAVSVRLEWTDPDLSVAGGGEHLALSGDGPAWLQPDASGLVAFTADQTRVGVWWANYTVTDALGLTDTVKVRWSITDVNDAPVITTVVPGTVNALEDQPFTLSLAATDLDADLLVWTDDCPLFIIGRSTGAVSFTPTQSVVGTHRVTVTVSDGRGGTAAVSFDLVVANVNDLPVLGNVAPLSGTSYREGEAVSFMATATDADGDALTYIWKEGTKELGRGSPFTTTGLKPGKHTVTLVVDDGNATVERQLDVVVRAEEGGGVGGAGTAILLLVVIAVIVVIAVVALAMRSRKGQPPAEQETASLAGPEGAAGAPGVKAPEGEEPPKIEIEIREV
jgi:hypothetical protein